MRVLRPILRRIGQLFRSTKDEGAPGEGPVEELWSPDRLEAKAGRFAAERGGTWEAAWREERLDLELSKAGLLAWSSAKSHIYDDFFVEVSLAFPPGEDYVAAGLMFRQVEDDDFYLLLLSSKGHVRLDVVFNGTPRPIVGWTEIPSRQAAPRAPAALGLVAQGSRFVVLVDGEWVAEAEDETNKVGSLAFAARTFETASGSPLRFSLTSILIESRKVEVEALRRRFTLAQAPDDGARRRLAETFVAIGHFLPAAVQMGKIAKRRPLAADELLLKAEIELRLGLLDDAAKSLDASLALDGGRAEAVLEKANLLYQRSLFPELRAFIEALPPDFASNARIALLLGHALSNLGDWAGAAAAYLNAAELEPGEPLLRKNAARALEMAGKVEAAAEAWLEAGKGFFASEERDELALAEANLARLDKAVKKRRTGANAAPSESGPVGNRHGTLKARSLFLAKKTNEALALAEDLIGEGSTDPVLFYLAGLIRAQRGEREKATAHYEGACRLAPDEALFAWRRAENLWLLGSPEARDIVEKALEGHPEDGWTLNLAARMDLELLAEAREDRVSAAEAKAPPEDDEHDPGAGPDTSGLAERIRGRLEAAIAALPAEKAPVFNLSEFLSIEGRQDEAIALLSRFDEDAEARNQAGNVRAREGQRCGSRGEDEAAERHYLAAEREYRAAIALDPDRSEYRENLASLYVELGRWTDAEDELRRILSGSPGPRTYLLAGNLAERLGDWPRAEATYRVGLDGFKGDRGLLMALGRLWILRRDWPKARDCASKLANSSPSSALRLEREILEASTDLLACSSCGRTWRVPRDLPAQSGANIRGMPPDEAPAGSCPACGRIYCIACAKEHLVDNRFTCPDNGEFLKLSDNRLRWLVREAMKGQGTG